MSTSEKWVQAENQVESASQKWIRTSVAGLEDNVRKYLATLVTVEGVNEKWFSTSLDIQHTWEGDPGEGFGERYQVDQYYALQSTEVETYVQKWLGLSTRVESYNAKYVMTASNVETWREKYAKAEITVEGTNQKYFGMNTAIQSFDSYYIGQQTNINEVDSQWFATSLNIGKFTDHVYVGCSTDIKPQLYVIPSADNTLVTINAEGTPISVTYTLNGELPTSGSQPYVAPIQLHQTKTISVRAEYASGVYTYRNTFDVTATSSRKQIYQDNTVVITVQ